MNAQRKILRGLAAAVIAATIVVPVLAQPTGGASVSTGPGTVTAARVLTVTATLTAIDMTTRQVTLRRPDGSTFLVVADERARNLPQLRVGDTVTVDYYDRLTLDLKKGGTGEAAVRTDSVSGSRAELGQRPGGSATRETVIVADVIAVNPAGQTISLRGPGGRVVDLPVKDPEQFKRIAVGDQVQATYVEAAALSITPAAMPAPAPMAAAWGRWMVGARLLDVYPNVSSSNSGFDVNDQWTGELDSTYFFTPNVAVEGSITWAKQDVSFNGTSVGALKMMPVTFTVQYHFTDLGAWKPYVGGGFNYTYFYENELGNNAGASVNRDSWGGALQAGFDYQFQRNWYFNADVKYLWINNDVRLNNFNNGNISSLDINPWVFGLGLRYRF
jgi:outer membrane protein